MEDIIKYIEYGVTIKKANIGYRVFTIPTQHFNIDSLEELTPDKFEERNYKKDKSFKTNRKGEKFLAARK